MKQNIKCVLHICQGSVEIDLSTADTKTECSKCKSIYERQGESYIFHIYRPTVSFNVKPFLRPEAVPA